MMNNAASLGRSSWFNRVPEVAHINTRAIARGFDRYLAPHGIRTQAQHQGDGCLCLTVECQTLPERDRLVQFMLHRLKQLNLAAIAGVKIIARLTGQSDDLWDHSVSFMPPVPQPLTTPAAQPRHMPPPPPPNPAMAHRSLTPTDAGANASVGAEAGSPPPDPFTGLADTLAAEAKAVKASVTARANRYYRRWSAPAPEQRTSRRLADAIASVDRRWSQMTTAASQWVQGGATRPVPQSKQTTLTAVAHCLEPLAVDRGWQIRVGKLGGRMVAVTVECALLPRMASEMTEFRNTITQAVCQRLWALNSPKIRGVRLGIREAGQTTLAWQQTIRLATPASRSPVNQWVQAIAGVGTLRDDPIWDRIIRSLLLGGTAIVPFILALWLAQQVPNITSSTGDRTRSGTGTASNTQDQTEQVIPFRQPAALPLRETFAQANEKRPPVVETALEVVPVTPHTAVTPVEEETVTLLFGGDVTLSNFFEDKIQGEYDKTFAKMPEYAQADVSMVNLENPLTTANTRRPGKTFNFKAKPESVEALTSGGVDIVTLGNNHAMDYQGKGLSETLEHLEKAGIHAVGGGRDLLEARRPKILEVKGQRIAYFGYYNAYWHAATDGSPGTNPRDFDSIKADMEAVRDQVDWIVVNYHWGEENAHYPAGYQRSLAQFTIDHGADLIVGHHPHVLQGAEVYKGKAIVYSLGNFIFGGNSRRNYVTAALQVSLTGDEMKLDFLPLVVQDYQPEILPGDRGQSIFNHLKHISRNFQEPLLSGTTLKIPKPASPESEAIATAPTSEASPKMQSQTQTVASMSMGSTSVTSENEASATVEPATTPPKKKVESPVAASRVDANAATAEMKPPAADSTRAASLPRSAEEAAAASVTPLETGMPTRGVAQGFSQAQTHFSQSQVELTARWAKIQKGQGDHNTAQASSPQSITPLAPQVTSETQKKLGETLAKAKAQLERQQSIMIAAELEASRPPRPLSATGQASDPFPLFSTERFTAGTSVEDNGGDRSNRQVQDESLKTSFKRQPTLPFETAQPPSFDIPSQSGSPPPRDHSPEVAADAGRLRPLTNAGHPPLLPFIEGAIQRAEASFR